jgi:hypothetical protein
MKLLEVNETYPVAKSNVISHGIHAKSIDSAKAGGLQKTVFMSTSAKAMLSVNLFFLLVYIMEPLVKLLILFILKDKS